jgi:hypothetical protein
MHRERERERERSDLGTGIFYKIIRMEIGLVNNILAFAYKSNSIMHDQSSGICLSCHGGTSFIFLLYSS